MCKQKTSTKSKSRFHINPILFSLIIASFFHSIHSSAQPFYPGRPVPDLIEALGEQIYLQLFDEVSMDQGLRTIEFGEDITQMKFGSNSLRSSMKEVVRTEPQPNEPREALVARALEPLQKHLATLPSKDFASLFAAWFQAQTALNGIRSKYPDDALIKAAGPVLFKRILEMGFQIVFSPFAIQNRGNGPNLHGAKITISPFTLALGTNIFITPNGSPFEGAGLVDFSTLPAEDVEHLSNPVVRSFGVPPEPETHPRRFTLKPLSRRLIDEVARVGFISSVVQNLLVASQKANGAHSSGGILKLQDARSETYALLAFVQLSEGLHDAILENTSQAKAELLQLPLDHFLHSLKLLLFKHLISMLWNVQEAKTPESLDLRVRSLILRLLANLELSLKNQPDTWPKSVSIQSQGAKRIGIIQRIYEEANSVAQLAPRLKHAVEFRMQLLEPSSNLRSAIWDHNQKNQKSIPVETQSLSDDSIFLIHSTLRTRSLSYPSLALLGSKPVPISEFELLRLLTFTLETDAAWVADLKNQALGKPATSEKPLANSNQKAKLSELILSISEIGRTNFDMAGLIEEALARKLDVPVATLRSTLFEVRKPEAQLPLGNERPGTKTAALKVSRKSVECFRLQEIP